VSKIVLVHGIAQSRKSADTLQPRWANAVIGGVRNAGHGQQADQLREEQLCPQPSIRVAFYGDLFRSPGAQGGATPEPGSTATDDLEERLAQAWLTEAARRASDPKDMRLAQLACAQLQPSAGQQGARSLTRSAVGYLANIRGFAPVGFAFAKAFVENSLREVSSYFTEPSLREAAQERVLNEIDDSTRLVIAHSLGTVVAFEALHRSEHPVALVTIGSPLALKNVIYDRLVPQPPTIPTCVTAWADFVDKNDLVAVHNDLRGDFPPKPGNPDVLASTVWVDNAAQPHDHQAYLTDPRVGQVVVAALQL